MAKLLVVDDDMVFRQTLGEILRLEGYEVHLVENGEAAIQELGQATYDLLLLDLSMPGMGGLEVMKIALQTAPDLKIILLTGFGSVDSAIGALRLGAHDYILKPSTAGEILSSVARGLSKRVEQQQRKVLLEQLDASLQRLKDVEGVYSHQPAGPRAFALEDGVMVDLTRREIWRGNQSVSLTPTEGKLLQVFIINRGRVMTHRELVLLVQGYETSEWEAPEVLRPLISRLRRKFSIFPKGQEWIKNVRGTGYVLEWKEDGTV